MKVQKNFILTASFFIHAVGMELQITHSGEQELDLNAFIDKMYQCKNNSADFIELSKQCSDEHKSSLINYFAEKASTGRYNREDELNSYKWNKNFDNVLEKIVRFNEKKHVKYNIAYSNAWRCIALLGKDLDIDAYEDEWSQWKTFADLMKNDITAQQTMSDICSFFNQESSIQNFIDIHNTVCGVDYAVRLECIQRAAIDQNMPVLVLLQSYNSGEELDKIDQYVYATNSDKEREILVKADDYFRVQSYFMRAIQEKEIDKAWSFLRIYIAQGHHRQYKYAALLKPMLEANLIGMVDMLLQEGFGATKGTIKTLTCDQIKIYVVRGYAICGAKFWDNEAHTIILHKAVQENNKEFVEYLLSLDAPTNVIDENSKTPILYSLNNDEIFNILVKMPLRALEAREKNDHELFRTLGYVSKPIDNLTAFIENNPEEKIIQLFQEKFFSKKAVSNWLDCAVELNKYDLFVFLVDKHLEDISEEQQQKLRLCAVEKERYDFAQYLYKKKKEVDQLKFIESVNQHSNNNDILCSLLNEAIIENNIEKVKIVLEKYDIKDKQIKSCTWNEDNKAILYELIDHGLNIGIAFSQAYALESALKLLDENAIKSFFEKHIKNITKEQAVLLLQSALGAENSMVVNFLVENECVSIKDMENYIAQMQPGYNITLPDQFSIIVERRIEEDEQNQIVDGVNQCTEELEQNGQGVENKEVIDVSQEKKDGIVNEPVQLEETTPQHVVVEPIINEQQADTTQTAPVKVTENEKVNEENKEIVRSEVEVSTDSGLWYVLYGIKNCFSWGIWLVSAPIRLLAYIISLFV